MSTFEHAIPVILHHEAYQRKDGSWLFYSNDPHDKGGPTAWGLSTLIIKREGITPEDLGIPDLTADSLKLVNQDTAERMYKKLFWDRYGYAGIENQIVSTKVFDACVNMGPGNGHRLAQSAANSMGQNLKVDGIIGPKTIAAINACDPSGWIQAMVLQMTQYYLNLIARDPTQEVFKNNWLSRAKWPGK